LMDSDELHWILPTPIWKKHSTISFQNGYIAPTSLWTVYMPQQWVFLSPDWLQNEQYYWLLCSNNVVCSMPISVITKHNVSHIHTVITLSHVIYNFSFQVIIVMWLLMNIQIIPTDVLHNVFLLLTSRCVDYSLIFPDIIWL
jgi:hypothetical protein